MKNSLRRSVDGFSTVLVMLLLIFGSLFITILVAFQVHAEVDHLIRLGANLLAQQPDWMLDYARNFTGDQLEKSDIDSYVEKVIKTLSIVIFDCILRLFFILSSHFKGYLKGREWLAVNARSLVGTQDPAKGEMLEKEVVEVRFSVLIEKFLKFYY